jgi:hypothetical protein
MRHSIALARRSDDIQPMAILGAIGVIVGLMVAWAGIVGALPGLH